MIWYCWQSHTCYVCTGGGQAQPALHATRKPKATMTSPCDTVVIEVEAAGRYEALRTAFPERFLRPARTCCSSASP